MSLTPMMRQYALTKEQVPDALLLYRMGDFYELFFEDAKEAARILRITLTSRDKGENPIPMAGFPHHSLPMHLKRLLEAGKRVAICDQVEDASQAVGLVRREITRVVTPGTLTDESLLDPRRGNYLVALVPARAGTSEAMGVAWLDIGGSGMTVAELDPQAASEELARLEPTEVILPEEAELPGPCGVVLMGTARSPRPAWTFTRSNAADLLRRHFGVNGFGGFGIDEESRGLAAAGALLAYLEETQRADLKHLSRLVPFERGEAMVIDPVTRRSLELTRTLRDNRREGSLLATIDRTVTAGGARCLAEWLGRPLLDVERIRYRQSAIEEWRGDPHGRGALRECLTKTYDVERLAARVSTGRTHPRDLAALRETLRSLPAIKARLTGRNAQANADLEARLDLLPELRRDLEEVLVDEPPLQLTEGGVIRDGYHPELDELRQIAVGGKEWMASFQREEGKRSGIPSLKVGFNKVFGYYVEVSNAGKDKVPDYFVRKQTLKNAERYITPELKEYEQKVLGAEERSKSLEQELFRQLRERVSERTADLQALAGLLAELDALAALGELAQERRYARPVVVEGPELEIRGGRHPVLDATMDVGRFVPNDTLLALSEDAGRFLLITGPNMAGKSTYIRQVALVTLLAQMGSFVPATSATIGVADRIFARVGASDELGRGQSTFMVEMIETANILHNATERSLVILDEIGRGTSTYDGVSLAWAIAEHLHDRTGCRVLFATHYHELIQLEKTLPRLRNQNVAVREWRDEIIFLHQIVDGGADRSYGIHVAKLAGVPEPVLRRAQEILEHLERDPFGEGSSPAAVAVAAAAPAVPTAPVAPPAPDTFAAADAGEGKPKKHRRAYHQLSLFPTTTAHPILDELRMLESESLTPQAALDMLRQYQQRLAQDDT